MTQPDGGADVLDGLAAADARIGGRFPVPHAALPLARWVAVRALGPRGAQVEWNLDDSRAGAPGRLALYAGREVPPPQLPADAPDAVSTSLTLSGREVSVVRVPLEGAQPSLRPVIEVSWAESGVHLRLTAQGPWLLEDVLSIVTSVHATDVPAA